MWTGALAIVMIFGIPLSAIITSHIRSQTKLKAEIIEKQIELERLKSENYLAETEKLRLELEKMNLIEYHGEDQKKIM